MTTIEYLDHLPAIFVAATSFVSAIGTVWIGLRSVKTRKLVEQGTEVSTQNSIAIEGVKVQVNGRMEQLINELHAKYNAEMRAAIAAERARNSDPVVVAKKAATTVKAAKRAAQALADARALNVTARAVSISPERRKTSKRPPKGVKERRKASA